MKYISLASCLVLLISLHTSSILVHAQDSKLKKANELFDQFGFPEAAEAYKKILAKSDDVPEAKIKLAECYRFMNMPVEAEYWYEQVVELPEAEPVHKYYYGMALKANGKFDEAKQMFMEYAQLVPADTRGLRQVEACEQANYFLTDPGIYQISICANINSANADFGPAWHKDGIVYASEENVKYKDYTYNWTQAAFLDLFYAEQEGDNPSSLGKGENFKGKINTFLHEGTVTFSQDETTMYFCRDNYEKGVIGFDTEESLKTVKLKIYEAKVQGDGERFGDIKGVSFNSDNYSVGHPSLSHDGQALYFVSDMPGGYGGTDVYVAYKSGDDWGTPENLGPEINTEGNEMFPFISADGYLYFSSDALPGLGGLDIFSSKLLDDGSWSAPENLRYPINTNGDDFAFIIDEENEKGYFSSNRPGGQGNDDIYSFTKLTNVMLGEVVHCINQEPIEGAEVRLMENGVLMQKRLSNANGGFTFPISPGKEYVVIAGKEGFEDGQQPVSTIGMTSTQVEVRVPICPTTDNSEIMCVLKGTVIDNNTKKPVSNATVSLVNVDTNEETTTTTDENGNYEIELSPEANFVVHATKSTYFTESKTVSTVGRDCANELTRHLAMNIDLPPDPNLHGNNGNPPVVNLNPGNNGGGSGNNNGNNSGGNVYLPTDSQIIITDNNTQTYPGLPRINHIYYDFDESYIRDDAKPELDKIVDFMIRNPQLIIELRSHTDSRGGSDYNQALSERRAQAALDYLIGRGIPRNKISAKGFGESELINECADGVNCSDEKHQDNRRTEFAIIGYSTGTERSLPRYHLPTDSKRGRNYYKDGLTGQAGFYDGGDAYNTGGGSYTNTAGTNSGGTYYDTQSTDTYNSGNTGYNSGGTVYDTGTTTSPNYDTGGGTYNNSAGNYSYDNSGGTYYDTQQSGGQSGGQPGDGFANGACCVQPANGGATTSTAGPYTGFGTEYRIQLGTFREPDRTKLSPLESIGLIKYETTENGMQRVLLGQFNDPSHAEAALAQAKQYGYNDAFVVKYENGIRAGR